VTSIYAHRGSAGPEVRENTLDAFRSAASLGADGVELDVRRTADGCLVIHHDIEAPGLGPISACRYGQLPEWVPTLVEALGVCGELGLEVNVEVKSEVDYLSHDPDERCAAESAAVCVTASDAVRIVVSSFSLPALAAVREVSSDLALAYLVGLRSTASARPWSAAAPARLALEGVHPHDAVTDVEYVRQAHADGLAVRVWTVDLPARVAQLARLGVEAVITNDVAAALRAVERSPAVPPA
jgi:glycerophosphoryl diester phosphodiesterase